MIPEVTDFPNLLRMSLLGRTVYRVASDAKAAGALTVHDQAFRLTLTKAIWNPEEVKRPLMKTVVRICRILGIDLFYSKGDSHRIEVDELCPWIFDHVRNPQALHRRFHHDCYSAPLRELNNKKLQEALRITAPVMRFLTENQPLRVTLVTHEKLAWMDECQLYGYKAGFIAPVNFPNDGYVEWREDLIRKQKERMRFVENH